MKHVTGVTNLYRKTSTNQTGSSSIDEGVIFVPPIRLYGTVRVAKNCSIGKYTYIGKLSHVMNADIGNYCSIARGVEVGAKAHPLDMLSTHSFQFLCRHFTSQPGYAGRSLVESTLKDENERRVSVGHDVWIGTKVVIQGGVTVGTGAVIGSSAVVTKDVPPYAIVAGIPARIIRYRFDEETIARLLATEWWLLDPADMDGIDFADIHKACEELEIRKKAFETQVMTALVSTLTNEEDRTNQAVLWFDVEKSYTFPGAIDAFRTVHIIENEEDSIPAGSYPIAKSWFDPVSNNFGVWTGTHTGHIPAGALKFRLGTE